MLVAGEHLGTVEDQSVSHISQRPVSEVPATNSSAGSPCSDSHGAHFAKVFDPWNTLYGMNSPSQGW